VAISGGARSRSEEIATAAFGRLAMTLLRRRLAISGGARSRSEEIGTAAFGRLAMTTIA